jgi:hypothetical protein
MKFTTALLFAALATVDAGETAIYKMAWVQADGMASFYVQGTITAAVASGAKLEVVLPTNLFCKPGADFGANIADKDGTASKISCAADSSTAVAVTKSECVGGTKLEVTVGADCVINSVVKFTIKKNIFLPNSNAIGNTGMKVGGATAKGTDTQPSKHVDAYGATSCEGGVLTLGANNVGKTGTLKFVTTYKAATTLAAADDQICMYFPGFTIPKDAKCKFYAEGKTGADKTVAADAADTLCQASDADTMYPIKDKKYTIECDKIKAPAAAQIELAFGVAFNDKSATKALSADFVKLPAVKTAAPTRAPTVPTRAPTRAFSAAHRSAAAGAAGFISAVVGYLLF